MTEHSIVGHNVGKEFVIGAAQRRHDTLRDALSAGLRRLRRPLANSRQEKFWALRHLDFEVKQGEVLGLIGRNGAGKSTLLKLLSRITEPSTGEIAVRGRVGSLLEVGTGFHAELTGRENIYLNGAILGMKRAEVARKFDEIVAFAEIGRFLDTPVKHYSSGMYLRLGFAVAAHLEPDILVVDEVLAVGDAEFQRKCLGKMNEVASDGRTVIFVSHNLDAIQRLCNRCWLLDHGELVADGKPGEIVHQYLSSDLAGVVPGATISLGEVGRSGSGHVRFRSASFSGGPSGSALPVYPGGPLLIRVELEAESRRVVESLAIQLRSYDGQLLVEADTNALGQSLRVGPGAAVVDFRIEALNLMPGRYAVTLWAGETISSAYDFIEPAFEIEVVEARPDDAGSLPHSAGLLFCDFSVREVSPKSEMRMSDGVS